MNVERISKENLKHLLEDAIKLRSTTNTCALEGFIHTSLHTQKPIEFWTCSTMNEYSTINILVCIKDNEEEYYFRYFIFGDDDDALQKLLNIITTNKNYKKILFNAVNDEHWSLIESFCKSKNFQLELKVKDYTYTADSNTIKTFPQNFDYTVNSLKIEETDYVNKEWKFHDGELTYLYLHDAIKYNPSLCVRNSENLPISYELVQLNCALSSLQTNKSYQGQGLASFTMTELAKKMLLSKDFIHAYIEKSNSISEKLHRKCGFVYKPMSTVFHAGFNTDHSICE